ncbi:MAG TPA: NAD(P)-dependent alcohol dehydrogenase [Fibrobacteria bacterium]|nr:NAD(P)-dependent alcohol dehydrogenase [Fibrobacteria bacterium]
MKAAVYDAYGPPEVVRMAEVENPSPKDHEILVRIHATTVTSADARVRAMRTPKGFKLISRLVFGVRRPRRRILGTELAGVVEATGIAVTKFKDGDAVFGISGLAMGCHAEYVCLPETAALALKPVGLSFEEAACLAFGGTTALSYLRKATVLPGDKVLVNGASGAVGTALVQLARHQGADVTAVCSAANAALVSSLGAGRVIDYALTDFSAEGKLYDVIADIAGTAPFARCRSSLKPGGRLLLVQASLPEMVTIPWVSLTSGRKIIAGPADERVEDVRFLGGLAASGKYKAVIQRRLPLENIVEAHRHVDQGHKVGNLVVSLGPC